MLGAYGGFYYDAASGKQFIDMNGNGKYDVAKDYLFAGNKMFIDANKNGEYTDGEKEYETFCYDDELGKCFIDTNGNKKYEAGVDYLFANNALFIDADGDKLCEYKLAFIPVDVAAYCGKCSVL